MKVSVLALVAPFAMASSLALADISYVSGTVASVDTESQKISIAEEKSGKVKTFTYEKNARIHSYQGSQRFATLRAGDDVTLKLKTTSVAR